MAFEIIPGGRGFIVSGELDMATESEFAAAFREVMPGGGTVTVDMRQLRFMDLSGVRAIIDACNGAPRACIILHGVHDEVQRIVELTEIEQLPNLHVMPCAVGV